MWVPLERALARKWQRANYSNEARQLPFGSIVKVHSVTTAVNYFLPVCIIFYCSELLVAKKGFKRGKWQRFCFEN
jgi:hypothetical protein